MHGVAIKNALSPSNASTMSEDIERGDILRGSAFRRFCTIVEGAEPVSAYKEHPERSADVDAQHFEYSQIGHDYHTRSTMMAYRVRSSAFEGSSV